MDKELTRTEDKKIKPVQALTQPWKDKGSKEGMKWRQEPMRKQSASSNSIAAERVLRKSEGGQMASASAPYIPVWWIWWNLWKSVHKDRAPQSTGPKPSIAKFLLPNTAGHREIFFVRAPTSILWHKEDQLPMIYLASVFDGWNQTDTSLRSGSFHQKVNFTQFGTRMKARAVRGKPRECWMSAYFSVGWVPYINLKLNGHSCKCCSKLS